MSGYQSRRVSVAIRTERAGTASLLNQVREGVRSVISASLPLAQVRTLDEVYINAWIIYARRIDVLSRAV